jgi:hypothetical protein
MDKREGSIGRVNVARTKLSPRQAPPLVKANRG